MYKLILIRGPICAGKTTTVNFLRNTVKNISWIDQDCLKRTIDKEKPSGWRDKMAFETTIYLAQLLMKKGKDIIADIHSSIPKQYNEYEKIALKHKYKLFSFLLYPPLKICQERNKARNIPDVKYNITEKDIKKYWNNLYRVKKEIIFDTSKVETDNVVRSILKETGLH